MTTENFFVRMGRWFITYPKTTLATVLVLFGLLLTQLQHLRIDTTAESFLHKDAKALVDYEKFRDEFGRDEFFTVVITGVDVFSLDFLATLRDIHGDLEQEVGYLQSVDSLVNVRSIYGDGDDLIAEDLLENFPQTEEELAVIKERIRGKDIYYGRLLNRDEDTVAIFLKILPYKIIKNKDGTETFSNFGDAELAVASNEIKTVMERYKQRLGKGEYYVGGTLELGSYMGRIIQADFGNLTAVSLLMIALVLGILFKRASGIFIPLIVMAISIGATIAMLPALGFSMQITTSIIPSFLLAVCIGDSVHILSIFYHEYDHGKTKEEAILYALSHTGVAVLFTSLTTAAGLMSFVFSAIVPIGSLGLFAAIGTMLALVLTLILVPVLLTLFPVKHKPQVDAEHFKTGGLPYKFTRLGIFCAIHHPWKVVVAALAIVPITLIFIPNLRFSQDSLAWFPDDNPVKTAVRVIEAKVTGSMPVEIIIDTGKDQGALDPEFLKSLDAWLSGLRGKELNGIPIRSVNSIVDLVKETNQAFNGNKQENYVVPDSQEMIAQELLLVEMDQADDLYQFTDKKFRKVHTTLILPWKDAILFDKFQKQLISSYQKDMGSKWPDMHLTGVIPIFSVLFAAIVQSAIQSYLISGIIITIMMIILLRNVADGLISMVPNLIPIMIVIAFMAITDMPMDVLTVLIGSIAVGLCVDDTIHFMHGFKVAYQQHGDAAKAIEDVLMSTGKALMITSIVLFWGFMTFTLSDLSSMDNFGILTAMCISLALVFDFFLGPALMMIRYGKKKPVITAS